MFDNEVLYGEHRKATGDVPIPPYWEKATPALRRLFKSELTITDAPLDRRSEKIDAEWVIEDCAICRVTSTDGTVSDSVLGCVKFVFKRVQHGKVELDVESGGKTLTGKRAYTVWAERPGRTWNAALEDWRKTTGDKR